MFNFEKGQELTVSICPKRINDSKGVVTKKIKVEGIYDDFVLFQGKHYKECFLLSSFVAGEIKVLGGM